MGARVSIALVGAAGRMGLEITRAAHRLDTTQIAAAVEHRQSPALGKDMGELAGVGPSGVLIESDLEAAFQKADVAIDLSLPEATGWVIEAARACKIPLVCGTTGINSDSLAAFDAAANEIPVLYTPNLSLGVAVTASLVEQAVKALGPNYDIEIVEMHHRDKADAPSGTALALAKTAARSAGIDPESGLRLARAGHTGTRPTSEIGVHAVRGGGVFGEHTVILAGKHEQIEIRHKASSRTLFAEGALRVAVFLHNKPRGRYTMADTF